MVVMNLGRRLARRIATAPPQAILLTAWAYLLVYAFPGIMTQDSFDHLREARMGIYSDGHPPSINLIWRISDYIVAGPFGMLLIQSGCFLAGLYLALRRVFAPRRAAWIASAVFLLPQVMMPFAAIWKDALMAGFLMLGFVALGSTRRGVRVLGLLAMFGATAVRYNAIGATFPLVVLLFEWRVGMPWLKRYAISGCAWLAVTFGSFQWNAAITDHQLHLWHTIAVFDIVGTLANVDEPISDDELRTLFAGTDLLTPKDIHATARELYTPLDFLPITNHPTKTMWSLPINGYVGPPHAQRQAIERAWRETLARWPLAYAHHRLRVMAEVIGLGGSPASGAIARRDYRWPDDAHARGLSTGWSKLQRNLTAAYQWTVRHTPLFTVWMYLAIAIAVLWLAVRQRDVVALLLSGFGIEATLVVLAPSPDYRYSHWMVVVTIVAAIVTGARRYRGNPPTTTATTAQLG